MSAPLNSVKNESTSNGFSTSCRKISSESLHSGSNELRSHELPGISWFWLFVTFNPVASYGNTKSRITIDLIFKNEKKRNKRIANEICFIHLRCTCKQAEISTIRPSLSGHHNRVSSINGIPVVALPLRREVFDAASVFIFDKLCHRKVDFIPSSFWVM